MELQWQPLEISEKYSADRKMPSIYRAPRDIDLGLPSFDLSLCFLLVDLDNADHPIDKSADTARWSEPRSKKSDGALAVVIIDGPCKTKSIRRLIHQNRKISTGTHLQQIIHDERFANQTSPSNHELNLRAGKDSLLC